MTAVSNTSPLNYLVLIDLQDVLPVLFGRVLIPGAVRRELEAHAAPEPIRRWMAAGREQRFALTNVGTEPVFSDFEVRNPQNASTYRVAIRGVQQHPP